jgi:hypothetical protein
VLKTVSVVHRVHRALKSFDNLDQDLTQFVELRVFSKCDQLLVPWSHDIEPRLA